MKPFPGLSFFEGKKILLLTHAGADIDSIAGAGAFYFSLNSRRLAKIGVPEHISLSAKNFAEKTKIPYELNPSGLDSFDTILAFDFSSPEMLGDFSKKLAEFNGPVFVFDHHEKSGRKIAKHQVALVEPKCVSCTEVVYKYIKRYSKKISKKAALLCASGIIADSGRFRVASDNTFLLMNECLSKSGLKYENFFELLAEEVNESERIARLKASRRARFFKSAGNLFAFSNVNAFESSSAVSMVFLGADVAFAGGEKDSKIIISARASNSFVSKTGFNLVRDVFDFLPKKFAGQGGGHAAAAGFNGAGFDVEKALLECVNLSHSFLQKKSGQTFELKELK